MSACPRFIVGITARNTQHFCLLMLVDQNGVTNSVEVPLSLSAVACHSRAAQATIGNRCSKQVDSSNGRCLQWLANRRGFELAPENYLSFKGRPSHNWEPML